VKRLPAPGLETTSTIKLMTASADSSHPRFSARNGRPARDTWGLDELIVGFTIGYSQYFTTLEAITAIVIQSFLALMAGLYFGRKVREGKIRISVERVSTGTKLIAGGILVTLSAVLLVGPPLATHAFPHFIHSYFPRRVNPLAGAFGGNHQTAGSRRIRPRREPADKTPPEASVPRRQEWRCGDRLRRPAVPARK
jgi:hypothetical protein